METNSNTRKPRRGKIAAGIVLVIAGALLFSKNMGVNIPDWLISVPTLLIGIGLISGIKHRFRRPGAYVLLLIGSVLMADKLNPGLQLHEAIFPIVITSLGVFLILKRNDHPFAEKCKQWHQHKFKHCQQSAQQ